MLLCTLYFDKFADFSSKYYTYASFVKKKNNNACFHPSPIGERLLTHIIQKGSTHAEDHDALMIYPAPIQI